MSVKRHTAYNLAGALIPTLLALGTIPLYLHAMGAERFGALSAIWIICGSVGFFDLGLNRALSYSVAKASADDPDHRAPLVATALVVGSLSAAGAALLTYFGSDWYFTSSFGAAQSVIDEVGRALPLVAATSITTVLVGVITGALQGNRSFLQANLFQTGMAVSLQVGPIVYLLPGWESIVSMMTAVLFLRIIVLAFGLFAIARELGVRALVGFRREEVRPLLSFSKWTMGIAFVGPIILYCDKILLGGLVGGPALAFYNIPFQLAQRIALIPGAVGSAIFPDLVNLDTQGRSEMTSRATSYSYMFITLPSFLVILFSNTLLELWLSITPSRELTITCGLLILSFWVNCASQVYHTSLVTMNRPATVFYIMVAEVIAYVPLQYVAISLFGVVGAAASFLLLCFADTVLMFRFSKLKNREVKFIGAEFLILAAGLLVSAYASSSVVALTSAAVLGGSAAVALRWRLLATTVPSFDFWRCRDA